MNDLVKKYIEQNKIKSYLSYVLDYDKILAIMTKEDIKEMEETYCEDIYDTPEESYISTIIQEYNYELACQNEDINYFLELIYGCEFDLEIQKNGKLDLIDMQGVYLGGIEEYEDFDNIAFACDRLSGAYFQDYYNLYI